MKKKWLWALITILGITTIVASGGFAIAEGYRVDAEGTAGNLTPFVISAGLGLLVFLIGIGGLARFVPDRSGSRST